MEYTKALDKKNHNTLWMDALKREMANVGVALKVIIVQDLVNSKMYE